MDELTCKAIGSNCSGLTFGHWIVEFISCRAKNYAYCLNTGQVVCKVRGFSLKFSTSQIVNLKNMEKDLYFYIFAMVKCTHISRESSYII